MAVRIKNPAINGARRKLKSNAGIGFSLLVTVSISKKYDMTGRLKSELSDNKITPWAKWNKAITALNLRRLPKVVLSFF